MSKILLIDGNSLMFRAFYATAYTGKLMKTSEGKFTNALFGFINMMSRLLETTDYAFVSFDAGKQTFRHKQYDEYKGTRKPLPDELREQIPLIKEYLDIMNIKRIESLDYEGDDLIASCAKKFHEEFDELLVITGDKDLLQLVDEKVHVGLTKKGVGDLDILTLDNFHEKMGFLPNQVIEYKAIVGDSSDNLPGIKGIGEKTALKLLDEYKSVDGIYNNLDKLTSKTKELFIASKDIALKCRYLATLANYALESNNWTKEDLKVKDYDKKALVDFYTKMEFTSMLKKVKMDVAQTNDIQVNTNEKQSIKLDVETDLSKISGVSYLVCEVFGTNYYKSEFLGIGIYANDMYFFVKKDELYKIKDYLESNEYYKYTFDYKTLYFVLKRESINIKGVIFDLLLNSYLINPSYANEDFKVTIEHFLDTDLVYYENIYGANTKMNIPDSSVYIQYALNKCKYLKLVKNEVLKNIMDDNLEFLSGVELDLSETLGDMEYDGLFIDKSHLDTIGIKLNEMANLVKQKIYNLANHEFNINSPKQLGEVLFEELGLPHGKKNKNGYSTNVDILEKLAPTYEICKQILDYRGYTKLVSTYVNGLYDVMYGDYIHPLYKQALTNTGRLSSIEPNIQNMPIRTERGQVIREIFVSRFPNGRIVAADYSQIELRVLAHISNDDKMIEAFNNNIDIHAQTASQIYDIPVDKVNKEMRRTAKAINFGIIYGMSSWGLSESLGITPIEANMFINKYFYNFSEAKECLDKFKTDAYEMGYSKTMFGRRRYIPELKEKNKAIMGFGERTAMNSPIQGSAADIIKIAMNKVRREMKRLNMKSIMIAQVHDELVFDCPNDEVEKMMKLVKEMMESAVKLNVVLKAEVSSGNNWFEAK